MLSSVRGCADTELYMHLLGLVAPWTVGALELSVEKQRVDVWVKHDAGLSWSCPQCSYTGTSSTPFGTAQSGMRPCR